MMHEMQLQPAPFEKIKSGRKTIELRLNDERRKGISVGDRITFTEAVSGEKLTAKVVKLHPFPTFAQLYANLPLEKCGYAKEEIAQANPADMNLYYSEEPQKKWGVLGIEIEL